MTLPFTIGAFFLLPLLAGGAVRVLRPEKTWLRLLLSFSGAFLLGVAVTHMLPELYEVGGEGVGLWILGGFLLQVVLEFFSHGIEHGHVHAVAGHRLPLLTLLSLCLHSFTEGVPFADPRVYGDNAFLLGVLLHKMPMAIALASVLRVSGSSAVMSWSILVVFALAAPAGIITGHMIGDRMGIVALNNSLGLAIGMLLHISTTIIFESAPDHRFNAARFVAVLVGAGLAVLAMH